MQKRQDVELQALTVNAIRKTLPRVPLSESLEAPVSKTPEAGLHPVRAQQTAHSSESEAALTAFNMGYFIGDLAVINTVLTHYRFPFNQHHLLSLIAPLVIHVWQQGAFAHTVNLATAELGGKTQRYTTLYNATRR